MFEEQWLKKYHEQIASVVNNFGNSTDYLGKGVEGVVLSIDDNYALKIYKDSRDLNIQSPIPELEPKVYSFGHWENRTWLVRELFDVPQKKDLNNFGDLIIEIAYFVESATKKYDSEINMIEVQNLAEKAYKAFEDYSVFDDEFLEKLRDLYELNENWVYQLTEEITYKSLTKRDSDFHSGNLGIRKADRRLIFFDW